MTWTELVKYERAAWLEYYNQVIKLERIVFQNLEFLTELSKNKITLQR